MIDAEYLPLHQYYISSVMLHHHCINFVSLMCHSCIPWCYVILASLFVNLITSSCIVICWCYIILASSFIDITSILNSFLHQHSLMIHHFFNQWGCIILASSVMLHHSCIIIQWCCIILASSFPDVASFMHHQSVMLHHSCIIIQWCCIILASSFSDVASFLHHHSVMLHHSCIIIHVLSSSFSLLLNSPSSCIIFFPENKFSDLVMHISFIFYPRCLSMEWRRRSVLAEN